MEWRTCLDSFHTRLGAASTVLGVRIQVRERDATSLAPPGGSVGKGASDIEFAECWLMLSVPGLASLIDKFFTVSGSDEMSKTGVLFQPSVEGREIVV